MGQLKAHYCRSLISLFCSAVCWFMIFPFHVAVSCSILCSNPKGCGSNCTHSDRSVWPGSKPLIGQTLTSLTHLLLRATEWQLWIFFPSKTEMKLSCLEPSSALLFPKDFKIGLNVSSSVHVHLNHSILALDQNMWWENQQQFNLLDFFFLARKTLLQSCSPEEVIRGVLSRVTTRSTSSSRQSLKLHSHWTRFARQRWPASMLSQCYRHDLRSCSPSAIWAVRVQISKFWLGHRVPSTNQWLSFGLLTFSVNWSAGSVHIRCDHFCTELPSIFSTHWGCRVAGARPGYCWANAGYRLEQVAKLPHPQWLAVCQPVARGPAELPRL